MFVFDSIKAQHKELKFNNDIDVKKTTFDKKHGHLIVSNGTQLFVYDAARDIRTNVLDLKSAVKGMSFSHDGKWLAVVQEDWPDTVLMYDIKNNYKLATDKPLEFEGAVKWYQFDNHQSEAYKVETDALLYLYSLKNNMVELVSVEKK
jgi:WD40 repeat protein